MRKKIGKTFRDKSFFYSPSAAKNKKVNFSRQPNVCIHLLFVTKKKAAKCYLFFLLTPEGLNSIWYRVSIKNVLKIVLKFTTPDFKYLRAMVDPEDFVKY